MKSVLARSRLLGIVLFLILNSAIVFAGRIEPARASAIGPLEIIQQSCSSVTIRFYYDGLQTDHTLNPPGVHEQFRFHVQNQTCAGVNCVGQSSNYQIAESYQRVPEAFGWITTTLSWGSSVAQGNGISVSVLHVNRSTGATIGSEISAFYQCSDPGPCVSCSCSGVPAVNSACGGSSLLFHCTGNGVSVSNSGVEVLQASFGQIAGPLATATTSGQNQPVAASNGVSLWALKSNELQAHMDYNPDTTKLIVPANVCGDVMSQATQASAPAQTVIWQPVASSGGTRHVVKPGENLFRISLRYGVSMQSIAAANGIRNYALIYAGQVLVIP